MCNVLNDEWANGGCTVDQETRDREYHSWRHEMCMSGETDKNEVTKSNIDTCP
jgi:hypothetical protein